MRIRCLRALRGVQTKLTISQPNDVYDECAWTSDTCAMVDSYCKSEFPNTSDLDALEKEYRDKATEYATDYPNAADNLNHYLDASGTTRTLPTDLFKNDSSAQGALESHRDKFVDGAEKRLKDSSPTPTSAMTWQLHYISAANAFSALHYTDLGLAVGGYQLCSTAQVTGTPAGTLNPTEKMDTSDC